MKMSDLLEITLVILVGILIIVLVVFAIASFFQITDYFTCKDFQSNDNGMEYRWTFWTGCRVLVNNVWVHYSNIKYDLNSGQLQIELDD